MIGIWTTNSTNANMYATSRTLSNKVNKNKFEILKIYDNSDCSVVVMKSMFLDEGTEIYLGIRK